MARKKTKTQLIKKTIILCPRCKQKMTSDDLYCKTCGFVINNDKDENQVLRFGKTLETKAISVSTKDGVDEYKQEKTTKILLLKKIQNFLFILIGLLSMSLLLLPLFSKKNMWYQCNEASILYGFKLNDLFFTNNDTNFLNIFNSVIEFSKINDKILNPNYMFYLYDCLVVLGCLILFIFGFISVLLAVKSLIFRKPNIYAKRYIGAIFATSMIMNFGLNCFGIGPILITMLCAMCLIFLYVCGIISKEKEFLPKQLTHKIVCIVLLLALVCISTFELVNLNATIGGSLYGFNAVSSVNPDIAPKIFVNKGVFLEYMQFIHSSSGDAVFERTLVFLNIFSAIMHTIYVFFAIFSIVSLLKSFSRQSIKFPTNKILISTIAFYCFAITILIFNQVVNEASLNKYIAEIGIANYNQLSLDAQNSIIKANSVFTIRPGFIISMIVYLPLCIYANIAKILSVRRTFG